jgi:GcrA cell cycle regulator
MAWTDERTALLKQHLADGLSFSQIAARLGGCSRNACIGKAARLGLSQPIKPRQTFARPRRIAPLRFVPAP